MAENPYVNKVNFGNQTVLDLTSDTVTPADVRWGVTFHDKTGESKTGNFVSYDGLYRQHGNELVKICSVKEALNDKSKITRNSILIGACTAGNYDLSGTEIAEIRLSSSVLNGLIRLNCKDCTNLKYISGRNLSLLNVGSNSSLSGTKVKKVSLSLSTTLYYMKTGDLMSPLDGKIPDYYFAGASSLEDVQFVDIDDTAHIKTIGMSAFRDCTSLDITIPDTITTIEIDAFLNVPHITYHGTATGAPWGALSMN